MEVTDALSVFHACCDCSGRANMAGLQQMLTDLGSGELQGLGEVVLASMHQVVEGPVKAAQVHVHGMAAQALCGSPHQLLQLHEVLPRVPLAVSHHHVGQLYVIHAQRCPVVQSRTD
jgi:hypothetical protein